MKFLVIFLALVGQAVVKARPDSYSSEEGFGTVGLGSFEDSSIERALSSADESSEEIPLQEEISYNPETDGDPDAFFSKLQAAHKDITLPQEYLEMFKESYNDYIGKPLPTPTPQQLKKIDMRLNKAEIKRTNELRQLHGSPKLVYDEKLAAFAQNYAEKISAKMAQGAHFEHNPEHTIYKIGENMAQDGPTKAIWDAKSNSYTFDDPSWKPMYNGHASNIWYFYEIGNYANNGNRPAAEGDPKETGHFTQTIWKNSKKMGCGMDCFKDSTANPATDYVKKCMVICNYYPAGNIYKPEDPQQPYDQNVDMVHMDKKGYNSFKGTEFWTPLA